MISFRSMLAILFLVAPTNVASAETYLHPDLGGVTTYIGSVQISVRNGGQVTSSMRVGNNIFHSSNFGLTGVSHFGQTGRIDVLSHRGTSRRSIGWYTPYRSNWGVRSFHPVAQPPHHGLGIARPSTRRQHHR